MTLRSRIKSFPTHPDEVRMTLGEHLEELRSRLIKAVSALVVGAIVCFVFSEYLIAFLLWPVFAIMEKHGLPRDIKTFSPPEALMAELRVAFIAGFILTAPYSLAQIWGFVAAGLYPHERKWVHRFAPLSIALFFTGAAFLITVVSPLLLDFLLSYRTELPDIERFMPSWLIPGGTPSRIPTGSAEMVWAGDSMPTFIEDPPNAPERQPWVNLTAKEIHIRLGESVYTVGGLTKVGPRNRVVPDLRISETIPFILHLAAAFGIGFQVPVVVMFLALVGIVDARTMGRARRYVWFGMGVAAAVLTPPDPGSMLLLLIPMALLFEFGLLAARMIEKRRSPAA